MGQVSSSDLAVVRELAKQYLEVTAQPRQAVKREEYRRFNDLEDVAPRVLLIPDDDGAWRELIPDASLRVGSPLLRPFEFALRRMLFHSAHFHDDQIFEPYLTFDMEGEYTGYHYGKEGQTHAWGIPIDPKLTREDGGAYALENFMATDKDFETLLTHKLDFIYDAKATQQKKDFLSEFFDGLLDIKVRVPYSVLVCALLIELVHLRDLTSLMMDLYDEPERMHRVMKHMSDEKYDLLKRLEQDGILVLNNDNLYTGSGGVAYSSRLPAPGHDGTHVRLTDIWGFADAQEFSLVSNDMFRAFVFPYQKRPLELFGLSCYGCCEPADNKLDDILALTNIWRISISPWSDIRLSAEKIGRRAIYSRKPNPALVSHGIDLEAAHRDIADVLQAAKGCQVEFILKDLRTCQHNPDNLKQWVDMAQSLCK